MPENNNFYVYYHRPVYDGKCFYVDKGIGSRFETTYSRNKYWYKIVKEHGFISEIIVNNISGQKELEATICETTGYENPINTGWGGHSHSEETIEKLSKPVLQYIKEGILIKEEPSTIQTSTSLNKNPLAITECCGGFKKFMYGYVWRHKDNPINESVKHITKKEKKPGSISSCISGKYKTSGGFKWFKSLNKKGGYFA